MNRIGLICISHEVASTLDISDLKPLYLEPIEVKDAPIDGLRFPGDPPWVKGRDATIPWSATDEAQGT